MLYWNTNSQTGNPTSGQREQRFVCPSLLASNSCCMDTGYRIWSTIQTVFNKEMNHPHVNFVFSPWNFYDLKRYWFKHVMEARLPTQLLTMLLFFLSKHKLCNHKCRKPLGISGYWVLVCNTWTQTMCTQVTVIHWTRWEIGIWSTWQFLKSCITPAHLQEHFLPHLLKCLILFLLKYSFFIMLLG